MSYQPARQADENQEEALRRMRGKSAFALLMAMRMRKSKIVIDEFGELELANKVEDLLIIAPSGVYRTWSEVLSDDLSEDLRSRLWIYIWTSGSQSHLNAFLAERARPRALLMNVEAFSRPGAARQCAVAFLKARRNIVVIDESTVIKNNSKRTKFINQQIRPLANYRRILSGLATPRSPLDLFYQFEFLDKDILGFNSHISFMKYAAHVESIQFGGRWPANVVNKEKGDNGFKPEAIKELQQLIAPYSFRVEFRPKVPSTFTVRDVEMTPEQRKAYNEIRDYATTQLAENVHVTATVVIAQIMRLHQVLCGHVLDENGKEHIIPENRTAELLKLLEDYNGKAVIWCSYDHDVKKIAAAIEAEYGSNSIARFWGGNEKIRETEEKSFKLDPECRFMIATPNSGGKGRTWDMADLAIYYSNRDNLEHRDQSEQRTMGRDKSHGVDNVDLMCRGTVEEKIIESLRKKINMASAINGDNYKQWLI